jgi:DNA adenine methylase
MVNKYWNKFNIVTKDHFYHNGGNIENRRTVVEALVCNFDTGTFAEHNHGLKEKKINEQLQLQLAI